MKTIITITACLLCLSCANYSSTAHRKITDRYGFVGSPVEWMIEQLGVHDEIRDLDGKKQEAMPDFRDGSSGYNAGADGPEGKFGQVKLNYDRGEKAYVWYVDGVRIKAVCGYNLSGRYYYVRYIETSSASRAY